MSSEDEIFFKSCDFNVENFHVASKILIIALGLTGLRQVGQFLDKL